MTKTERAEQIAAALITSGNCRTIADVLKEFDNAGERLTAAEKKALITTLKANGIKAR